jgi:hypothetical protein
MSSSTLTPPASGSMGALRRRTRDSVGVSEEEAWGGSGWGSRGQGCENALEDAEQSDGHADQMRGQHRLPGLLGGAHHDPAVETEEVLLPGLRNLVSLDLVEDLPHPAQVPVAIRVWQKASGEERARYRAHGGKRQAGVDADDGATCAHAIECARS